MRADQSSVNSSATDVDIIECYQTGQVQPRGLSPDEVSSDAVTEIRTDQGLSDVVTFETSRGLSNAGRKQPGLSLKSNRPFLR